MRENSFTQSTVLSGLVAAFLCALVFYRLHFGLDFTDEAQYIGQAMMLLNGGKPFESDLFFQQTASWLLVPFFAIQIQIQGNSDGVFLTARILYFVFTLACSTAVFSILRDRLPREALLLSILNVVFIPFSIPSISYNTLAINFLFVASTFVWRQTLDWEHSKDTTSAVLLMTLATFFYPTAILALLAYGVILLLLRPKFLRVWVLASAACALVLWGATAVFVKDLSVVFHSLEFTRAHGALRPAGETLQNLALICFPTFAFVFAPVVAVILMRQKKFQFAIYFAVAVGLSILYAVFSPLAWPFSNLFIHALFSFLLSAIAAKFVCANSLRWSLLAVLSFVLTICFMFAFTSSNGLLNGTFGMIALIPFSFYFFGTDEFKRTRFMALFSVCAALLYGSFSFTYREAPIRELSERVSTSPFRGLFTTVQRARFIEDVDIVIGKIPHGSKVFSFFYFPAAYSWSGVFPQTNALYYFFACTGSDSNLKLLPFIESQFESAKVADFLIFTEQLDPAGGDAVACDPKFRAQVLKGFEPIDVVSSLRIYRRRDLNFGI